MSSFFFGFLYFISRLLWSDYSILISIFLLDLDEREKFWNSEENKKKERVAQEKERKKSEAKQIETERRKRGKCGKAKSYLF